MARYPGDKRKEYRYELIHIGQGHYVVGSYDEVKREAQKFADEKNHVVAFQRWSPGRGKPILLRPKYSVYTKKNKQQIIAIYKMKGYDVSNYGGH